MSGWFPKCPNFVLPLADVDCVVDEGSEEQLRKKLKSLEDRVTKLTGTNTALTNTVRAFQKEKAHGRDDTDDDRGSNDNDDEDDSPMLFSARKVCLLS